MLFSTIFILQLVFFRFVTTTIKNSTIDNNRTLLKQLVSQIDSYISEVEKLSLTIAEDIQIQNYLENENDPKSSYDLEYKLYNYKQARTDISNILVYSNKGKFLLGEPDAKLNPWTDIENSKWYRDAIDKNGNAVISTSYVQNIIVDSYSWVVSLSREIYSSNTGESLGVVLVDLKFNKIDELCRSLILGEKAYSFIIDSMGNYIYHPTQQLLNSNLRSEPITELLELNDANNNGYYFFSDKYYLIETSVFTNWSIVGATHNSDIITDWKNVQLIYTVIGLLLFLIVGPATKRISSGITQPVRKLQAIMKTVENGEFNLIGKIKATEEIQKLAYDYDIMVGKIRELIETSVKDQEQKRKSDLIALQAQINPHFLYNTLDSIIWMGEMGQNKKVVKMTSALSKLFRISISKGNEIVKIRDEIAHVQSYLTIQEMRYQDKFNFLIDIDPELNEYHIIKITLQPLIENAIYHGIKECSNKGFIKITSKFENDIISISVADNGSGMSDDQVENLCKGLESNSDEYPAFSKQGIGLSNVHQRIQLYFGIEYGLSIKSSPGFGTTVTVTIPALTQDGLK